MEKKHDVAPAPDANKEEPDSTDYLEPSFELVANDLSGQAIPNITNVTCVHGCK